MIKLELVYGVIIIKLMMEQIDTLEEFDGRFCLCVDVMVMEMLMLKLRRIIEFLVL